MKIIVFELYEDFVKVKVVFFKGDLNYRKLVSDRKWFYIIFFIEVFWGFLLVFLCLLRIFKVDV